MSSASDDTKFSSLLYKYLFNCFSQIKIQVLFTNCMTVMALKFLLMYRIFCCFSFIYLLMKSNHFPSQNLFSYGAEDQTQDLVQMFYHCIPCPLFFL
jgi:hypothetical protein